MASTICPCGSGLPLGKCCGPVLDDPRAASSAEALMRSRYTAHVLGRWNHLYVTWHPRTRPELIDDDGLSWTGLEVVRTQDGQPGDSTGVVEYRAFFRDGAQQDCLHEVARFARRAVRWCYVDGDLVAD
ncbi:YchJ family protein [Acidipropionibacterium jensenii]|uniref:YchJ family protein n=1 Tax=Acidipropionibacterium jensenii TaxID=1749 RepID=UPI002649C753|nr:YchJ family metal-binding protein [Acidipropionibacterium jensenii]